MSLKSVWKKRAATRAVEQPAQILLKTPRYLAEIRHKIGEALKDRMPMMAHAIDTPTSTISNMLDAIAAVDADLYKQVEELAEFIEENGVKLS